MTLRPEKAYEYGHGLAYQLARGQLSRIEDIEQQCRNSGAQYVPARNVITIEYLNRQYQIALPDAEISLADSGEEVPIRDRILILHYFARAKGTPLSGKLITYKELTEGINYFPTFRKRAIKPIVDHFGKEPGKLLDIAGILGGRKADYGDMAVTVNAFSRVPITFVLWKGDEDFAPEGNIMFDSTISDYLPTEDITVLSETIAWRLVKLLRAGGDKPARN